VRRADLRPRIEDILRRAGARDVNVAGIEVRRDPVFVGNGVALRASARLGSAGWPCGISRKIRCAGGY
jgi:hypothetical protein